MGPIQSNVRRRINIYRFTVVPALSSLPWGVRAPGSTRTPPPSSRSATEGRGPVGPCGRDRQVLLDYHPEIRVLLPTRLASGPSTSVT